MYGFCEAKKASVMACVKHCESLLPINLSAQQLVGRLIKNKTI
jgi:hypothetical protein